MIGKKTCHALSVGAALAALLACAESKGPQASAMPLAKLDVTSPALQAGAPIPAPFACTDYEHLGKSPPLAWSAGPAGTVAYAVTAVDPDAKGFVHWAVVDLPASTTSLPEGVSAAAGLPPGAVELANDFDKKGYGGPCPPPGAPHHYVFKVVALKAKVSATKPDAAFFHALDANALAAGSITVTFKR
jgi:Raf kinase inhibitor-like YbhB/YbcL family protein